MRSERAPVSPRSARAIASAVALRIGSLGPVAPEAVAALALALASGKFAEQPGVCVAAYVEHWLTISPARR